MAVVVNGQQMSFDQPPIERAGRVFVPLRGIFERLGASVVYANGVINATGNGRNISLRIGSTQATVNGASQFVDVAPFLIGARTLVPLRFVAQALGAAVDYNNSNSTVTITGSGGNGAVNTPAPNRSFFLTHKRPETSTGTASPAIHAEFSEPVRRDTVHVMLDSTDLTNSVYGNANGFDVTPPSPLNAGSHHVSVTGTTEAGNSFTTGWTFTTGTAQSSGMNFITHISPAANATVQSSFTLSGRTLPNAHVHIVASSAASAFGGLLQIGTGTFQTDVTADTNGAFSTTIATNATGGSQIRVLLQSTAANGSSTERSITYST